MTDTKVIGILSISSLHKIKIDGTVKRLSTQRSGCDDVGNIGGCKGTLFKCCVCAVDFVVFISSPEMYFLLLN